MKFEPYRYIPKKKIKNAAVFSGMFIFTTAALWIIPVFIDNPNNSSYLKIIKMIYLFSGVITATVAIQVTTRFIVCGYIYILDKTDFIIVRASGKKSVQVCNINLETAIEVIEPEKSRKIADIVKQFGKITARMNFCQNLFSDNAYSYIFDFDGKKSLIRFEGDENFAAEMKRRIEYAKSQSGFGEEAENGCDK